MDLVLSLAKNRGDKDKERQALFGFIGLLLHSTEGKLHINMSSVGEGKYKVDFDESKSDVNSMSKSGKTFYNYVILL